MEKVFNKDEAMDFFLSNSTDNVICVKDGVEKECNCFPDALAFFDGWDASDKPDPDA